MLPLQPKKSKSVANFQLKQINIKLKKEKEEEEKEFQVAKEPSQCILPEYQGKQIKSRWGPIILKDDDFDYRRKQFKDSDSKKKQPKK